MSEQTQLLADTDYHRNPTDEPRPFSNRLDSSRRIPEKFVSSSDAKFEWRIGNRNAKVTGGFNEVDPSHSSKRGVRYLDDTHLDPDSPGVKSGNLNIGLDYVVDGNELVTPWYSGTVDSISRVKASDTHSYGNQVVIKTNQSYEYNGQRYPLYTTYSHLQYIDPSILNGTLKEVNTGTFIGKMGRSGLSEKFGRHVDFQSYIMVEGKKIHVSPNLMQRNLEKQQQEGTFRYSQKNTGDSTTVASNTITKDSQQFNGEAVTNSSNKLSSSENQNLTTQETDPKADVSKVVALLKENAAEVKKQYGLDVTTEGGLGKAVMQYWKENNLDPKILKEQLPNIKESEIATTNSKTTSPVESRSGTDSRAELSKVVALLKNNAAEVKKQSGFDVTTDDGLGRAVMQYWKENNLDPKTLKEQLPNIKDSEFAIASAALTNNNAIETTKTKDLAAQR
jgi:Peptidase family M23